MGAGTGFLLFPRFGDGELSPESGLAPAMKHFLRSRVSQLYCAKYESLRCVEISPRARKCRRRCEFCRGDNAFAAQSIEVVHQHAMSDGCDRRLVAQEGEVVH